MIRKKSAILHKLSAILLCVFLSISMLVGCNKSNDSLTVTLDKTEMTLQVNESKKLTATVSDNSAVTWTSADEAIVSVTDKGVITGKAVGETTVTAQSGETSASCKITVIEAEETDKKRTAFSAGVGASALFVGESIPVTPTLTVDGEKQADIVAQYSSTNTSVATVQDGVLTAISVGETMIKATCTHNGATYEDTKTLEVVEYNEDTYALTSVSGKIQTGTIVCVNGKSLAEQFKIRIYTKDGINDCSLSYVSLEDKVCSFNLTNESGNVGNVKLTLIDGNGNSLIGQTGEVSATLENNATISAVMQINSLTLGERNFNDVTSYQAFVKASNVYTYFQEFGMGESISDYFDYDFATVGGELSIDNEITYNGMPSLKITVPTNMSSFYFKDLALNYQDYGLTVGSKISFKIRYDGAPKNSSSFYAIGKITTKDGVPQRSLTNVISYNASKEYITNERTEWLDVSFVLDEQSFPLVDLGLYIQGSSKSTWRYVYIACITIDNPASVDYTMDFSRAVEWDNTGKNANVSWWGYSLGVGNAFKMESVPNKIATAYETAFGVSLPASVQVATPTLRETGSQSGITEKVVLQNSSCLFNDKMKGVIYQGNTRIKVRVYMQAEGTLPAESSVPALVFLRGGGLTGEAGDGFAKDKLQTLSPNVWTEFYYDVPEGYLLADKFTVAFNLRNYYQCNEDVVLKFYLGSVSFVV